jgi:hypothetical protein
LVIESRKDEVGINRSVYSGDVAGRRVSSFPLRLFQAANN